MTQEEIQAAAKKQCLEEVEKFFAKQAEYLAANPTDFQSCTVDDYNLFFQEAVFQGN